MAKSIKLANSEQKFYWSNQSRNENESKELQFLKSNKITPQSSPTKYVQVCQNKLDDQTSAQLELIDQILKRLDHINNEIFPNEYKFNGYFYQSPIYKNVVCWKKTNEKKVITVAIDPDKHSNKKQIQDDPNNLVENKFKSSFHSIKSNDSNKEGFRPILSKELSSSIVNKTSVEPSSNERFFKPIQNSNTLSNVEYSNEILKEPKTNQSVLKSGLDEYDYSKSPEEILKKKTEFDYKEFLKNYSGPKSTIDNLSEKETNSVYNDSLAKPYEDESKILQKSNLNEINNEKKPDEKENDRKLTLNIFYEKFNKDTKGKIPFVFECYPTDTSQTSQNMNNILLKLYFDLEQYLKTNSNKLIELDLDAQQLEPPQPALSDRSNYIFQSSSFNHHPSLISTSTYRKTNSEILPNRIGFNNNMSRYSYSTDTVISRETFLDNLRKMSEKHRSENLNDPPSIYKLRRAYSSLIKTNEGAKNDNNQSFDVVSSIIYDQNPDYYMNQNYLQESTSFNDTDDGNLRLIAFFNEMDKIYYEEEQKLNKTNQSQTLVNKVMIQESNLNNLTNSSNNTNLESESYEKMNISSDIEDLKVKSVILNQQQSSNSINESNSNHKMNISMTELNNRYTKSPSTFQPILVISKSPNQIKTEAENSANENEKKISLENNETKPVLILSNASFGLPVANNALEKRELEQKNSSAENIKIFGLESQIVVHDRQQQQQEQQPIQKQMQQNQKTSTDTENDDPNNKVPPARKKKKPSQSSKIILGGVIVTSTSHVPSAITPSTSKPSSVTVSNSAQPSSETVSNSTSLKEPNKLKTENIDKVENYVTKFEHQEESEDFKKSLDKTDSETNVQKLHITSLIVSNNVKIEQKNLKEADTDEEFRSFSNQADSFLRKLKVKKQLDDNQSKKSLQVEEKTIDEKELNKEKKSEEKKNIRTFSDLADSILRKAKSRENVNEANQKDSIRTDSELEHKSSLSEKIAVYEEYSRSSGYIPDESLLTKSNKTDSRSTLHEASEIHTITNDELNESDYDINKFNAIILPDKLKSSNKDNGPSKAKKYVSSKNSINTSRRKTEKIIADTKDLSSDSSDNKPIKKSSRSNSFILNKILLTDMNRPKLDDKIYYKDTQKSNINSTLKSSDKALKEADDYLKIIKEQRKKIESDLSRNTSISNVEERSNKKSFDEKMFQVKSEQPQLSRNQFSGKQTRPNEESLKESSINNNSNSDNYSDSNLNKSFKRKSSLFDKIFSKNKK